MFIRGMRANSARSESTILEKMKDDDQKSRLSRAELHLKARVPNDTDEINRMLADFISKGSKDLKPIRVGSLLEGNPFERLYRSYRGISADAAHVSITSLNRHYAKQCDRTMLMIDPALDDLDNYVTFAELGIAMTLATFMLMKIKTKTSVWDEFQNLSRRYSALNPNDGSEV